LTAVVFATRGILIASRARRTSSFRNGGEVSRHASLSSSAQAEDPVRRGRSDRHCGFWSTTGSPACATPARVTTIEYDEKRIQERRKAQS
jgi:hypothetical protein